MLAAVVSSDEEVPAIPDAQFNAEIARKRLADS
jgi:hypothetical protein